ncbi:MAG: hypothetical protein IKF99_00130 [Oscillospiraceae bacterium]|nr:hypothetical protein [Oscillospiraceae bacterium]
MSKKKEFEPYEVEVEIEDLNIRTGPGYQYDRTGKFTGAGTFTIVDECDGFGKLKAGAGWICLDFCRKV